jgi:hypothetical protein
MKTTKASLATQFARNIVELERRGDFGGLHAQAMADFTAEVFVWGRAFGSLYKLPNGRKVKDRSLAVAEWATAK